MNKKVFRYFIEISGDLLRLFLVRRDRERKEVFSVGNSSLIHEIRAV